MWCVRLKLKGCVFFFVLVLFPRHTSAATRDNTINLIHTLRDYLHYHIKCSKVSPLKTLLEFTLLFGVRWYKCAQLCLVCLKNSFRRWNWLCELNLCLLILYSINNLREAKRPISKCFMTDFPFSIMHTVWICDELKQCKLNITWLSMSVALNS
jgi:hypothetical protein